MTNKEQRRYQLLFRVFLSLKKNLKLNITIDWTKLYQATMKYWEDTEKIKACFPCGKTNEVKQCVLTLKALNAYRPISISDVDIRNMSFNLSHINEIFALYCGFLFIKKDSFRRNFMFQEDLIYLLENSQINYEQLMITLNIFYKDYS